jgi:DNA-binding transcriptional LysR family regulator
MPSLPRTTLEQWAVLRAVVEQGGYAQAAQVLHRSQSSVSYAIAALQEALPLPLVELRGRRAVLTEAGHALLAEASPLIDDMLRLEGRGRLIASGENARIRLVVDSLFPKFRLFHALEALSIRYPHLQVDLRETVRRTAPDPEKEPFDLAIAMPTYGRRYGRRVAEIELIAVAGACHPLGRRSQPLSKATLLRHVQVDIRAGDDPLAVQDETSGKIWKVTTVEAALAAVRQGLCFGWLPRDLITADLAAGDVVPLSLVAGGTRLIPLDLSFADSDQASPSIHWLADRLSGPDGRAPQPPSV